MKDWLADPSLRHIEGFDVNTDLHGEHDFGALEAAGDRMFFKVACFDRSGRFASSDPPDTSFTACGSASCRLVDTEVTASDCAQLQPVE